MSKSLTPTSYQAFCDFLENACGILLGAGKEYLVSSRLRPLFQENGLDNMDQLLAKVKGYSGRDLKQQVIDAMTTNETLWFRDMHPYNYLQETLAEELVRKAKGRAVRIWSAACSTGQEPYSLSICLEEVARRKPGMLASRFDIVATDIAPSVLQAAKIAEYDSLALSRGMSSERLKMFFDPLDKGKEQWKVKEGIRRRVTFRALNLQESYIGLGGKLDVIFCRNVLIYFSADNKKKILEKMHKQLNKGGVLILGASESLGTAGDLFEMKQYPNGLIYIAK